MTLKNHTLSAKAPIIGPDPLEGLDDKGLLEMRQRIDGKLKVDLARLNLAEELGLQYKAGMELLAEVTNDKGTPANQKAQVFNSVSKMLQDIIKSQKIVFSAERQKRFESAFLKVLQQLPVESTRTYFDLYGEFLKENPDALASIEELAPGTVPEAMLS